MMAKDIQKEVEQAFSDNKLAQILYHDWESETYDEKWSISFDSRCGDYASSRVINLFPENNLELPLQNVLEIGSGTGFFLLNLMNAGIVETGTLTDISPGMVKIALENAKKLNLNVNGKVSEAEILPFDDNSFDFVIGHAILHHIPDVEQAFKEVLRVLKPGGRYIFAGEPSKIGDKYARFLGNLTWKFFSKLTKYKMFSSWIKPEREIEKSSEAAALEAVVDLHTFDPEELRKIALDVGSKEVIVKTDEFLAALVGWPFRTFEAIVADGKLGFNWANFAYKTWILLSKVDENIFSKIINKKYFYNVSIAGKKK